MSKIYCRVIEVCWGLGLICTLATIVLKVLLMLNYKSGVTPRGSAILAAACFLGALATGEARKTLPPS
jgi:hypothetical protein